MKLFFTFFDFFCQNIFLFEFFTLHLYPDRNNKRQQVKTNTMEKRIELMNEMIEMRRKMQDYGLETKELYIQIRRLFDEIMDSYEIDSKL